MKSLIDLLIEDKNVDTNFKRSLKSGKISRQN